MRTAISVIAILAVGLYVASRFVDWRVDLPPVAPSVEQVCAEAMQQKPPDLSWVAPDRDAQIRREAEIKTVSLGELLASNGRLLRVAGVLHVEFESVGLFPSRAAMDDPSWHAPWVALQPLWPGEPYWRTKGPVVSDRCVVLEGRYSPGVGGHFGMFNGMIRDVVRLDVWSNPHRPYSSPLRTAPGEAK